MDEAQQPTQSQQNNFLPPLAPPTPEPKKTRFLPYTLAGLLIVGIAVLAMVFLLPRTAEQKQRLSANLPTEVATEPRAIFAAVEGLKMNIYSSKEDGSDRKLILSQDISEPNTRAKPFMVADIQVSPAKNLLAYKFPQAGNNTVSASASVFLIDSQGQNKKKILDAVETFSWSRDGKKIMYSTATPKVNNPNAGISFSSPGPEWHTFEIANSKDTIIAKPEQQFHSLGSWINETEFVFISTNTQGSELVLYDSSTQKSEKIELPDGFTQVREVSTNPSGSKTVVSLLPEKYGMQYSCDFYEIHMSGKLGKHLIADKNYSCEGVAWNSDTEFYYGKGTGPNGFISTSETSESGYYVLLSVYTYNFNTGKDELVLKSDGKEVYRFQNVLENQGFVVSNESNKRTPRYLLEMRELDGSSPRELFASDNEMLFIGWSE